MMRRWSVLLPFGLALAVLAALMGLAARVPISVAQVQAPQTAMRALHTPWTDTRPDTPHFSAHDTLTLGLPWHPVNRFALDSAEADVSNFETVLTAQALANPHNLPLDSLVNRLTKNILADIDFETSAEDREDLAAAVQQEIRDAHTVIQRSRGTLAQWRALLPTGAEVLEYHPLPNACATHRAYLVWMHQPVLCSEAAGQCCCWEEGAFWEGTPHLSLINTQTGQLLCTTPLEVSFVLAGWPLHYGLFLSDLDHNGCAAECTIAAHWDTRGDGYSTAAYGYHPAHDRIRRLRIRYLEYDFNPAIYPPWIAAAQRILAFRGGLPTPAPIDSGYVYDHPLAFWEPLPSASGQWHTRYYFKGSRHSQSGCWVQYNPQTDDYDATVWGHAPHQFDNPNTRAWEVLDATLGPNNLLRFGVVPLGP